MQFLQDSKGGHQCQRITQRKVQDNHRPSRLENQAPTPSLRRSQALHRPSSHAPSHGRPHQQLPAIPGLPKIPRDVL